MGGAARSCFVADLVKGVIDAGLDECVEKGMLTLDGGIVQFRHELARRAIEASIAPAHPAKLLLTLRLGSRRSARVPRARPGRKRLGPRRKTRSNTASPHFEQAYSDDGGKTWEVNWITEQTKVKP